MQCGAHRGVTNLTRTLFSKFLIPNQEQTGYLGLRQPCNKSGQEEPTRKEIELFSPAMASIRAQMFLSSSEEMQQITHTVIFRSRCDDTVPPEQNLHAGSDQRKGNQVSVNQFSSSCAATGTPGLFLLHSTPMPVLLRNKDKNKQKYSEETSFLFFTPYFE